MIYFGKWDDPQGALAEYRAYCRESNLTICQLTPAKEYILVDAVNDFLTAKQAALQSGELAQSTFSDYRRMCGAVLGFFGNGAVVANMTPSMFSDYRRHLNSRGLSLVSLTNEIVRTKVLFRWVWESGLIPAAINFGPDFKKPSARAVRKEANGRPQKLFSRQDVERLLVQCGVHDRAMLLLGINCAYGPGDLSELRLSHVSLGEAWATYARPKTEVDRECALWPETVAALQESLTWRPAPTDRQFFFLRPAGEPWSQNLLSKRFNQIRAAAGLKCGGHYWLRHTFRTVADSCKDNVAVDYIMGHADHSMAAVYREGIDRCRIQAVAEEVRRWLFGERLFRELDNNS